MGMQTTLATTGTIYASKRNDTTPIIYTRAREARRHATPNLDLRNNQGAQYIRSLLANAPDVSKLNNPNYTHKKAAHENNLCNVILDSLPNIIGDTPMHPDEVYRLLKHIGVDDEIIRKTMRLALKEKLITFIHDEPTPSD